MSKTLLAGLAVGLMMLGGTGIADATPIAIGGALMGPGNGVNARWVNTSWSPHNVDQAINALSLHAGDAGYVSEINQIATAIDFADASYGGITYGYAVAPLHPDDNFAVGYSGFLNVTKNDTYTFAAFTDDGFRLNIGGEQIMQHYGDRAPGWSYGNVYLTAGLYSFEMIGWEQGGAFVNELSWRTGYSNYSVLDSQVLFTTAPVPEPATMLLMGTGIAGLAGIGLRRKKQ